MAPDVATSDQNWSDTELKQLAQSYLYQQLPSEAERKAVLDTVRGLNPEDSQRFASFAIELQSADIAVKPEDATIRELVQAYARYARAMGLIRLNLTDSEADEAVAIGLGIRKEQAASLRHMEPSEVTISDDGLATATQPLCIYPYVACEVVSYPYTDYGASCGSGCVNGVSFDRKSNSACEELACDYRVFYYSASRKTRVDGTTPAADCVINYYGGIITRWESNYTQLGYGVAGPTYCLILSNVGSYLMQNTQVF